MSKLMRMNILGIRSFGPDEEDLQKIRFQSPLTLIQGQNGCGKTTIIESIKFAITGELPGGASRGQGFVYDPKLAKAYETRGQVRLRVSDTKGEWVTVTKSVSVSQKTNEKLEFKRVDSSISRGRNDEINQLSGRCANIDQEMCTALGVSKPILNSVIFCHQEDSNWPLDEAKKLKERFDDIFDATKYNKCLDTINKYIKTNIEKQKLLQFDVSTKLDIKNNVEGKKLILLEKEGRLVEINDNIIKVAAEIQPINVRLDEIHNIELNFTKLYTNVELKKKELIYLKEQQEDILKNVTEFTGTDDELNDKVGKFEGDLMSLQTDIEILKHKKLDIETNEKTLLKKINEQQKQLGGLQMEMNQNESKTMQRNQLVKSAAKEFNLNILPNIDKDNVKEIIKNINEKLETDKQKLADLQRSMEHEEELLQSEIDQVREQNAQLKQNIDSKTKQLSELRDEYREIQHQLEELNTADDQLKLADSKLNRIEKEIKALDLSVNTDQLRTNIDAERKKQKTLQERLALVESEIKTLQQYTTLQTELDVKNENFLCKKNEMKKLRNKHEKSLIHILDTKDVPNAELKSVIETYQKTQNRLVRELHLKINEKQREVLRLENNLSSCKEKLNEKEIELEKSTEKLSKYCKDKKLDVVVKSVKDKLEKLQDDKGTYFSSKYLYQKFIKQFQEDESCPLCKRRMEEKALVKTIIDDLRKKIENFPNELRRIEKELIDEQKVYKNLLELTPTNEKMQQLENSEIPVLKSEIDKFQTSLNKSTEELNVLRGQLSVVQKNEEIANGIMGDVSLIDQYQKEILRVQQEITVLTSRMPKMSESLRGMEEAFCEQETLNIDIRTAQNNIESSQSKLAQHTERLHKLKEQKNDLVFQQLNIKKNLQGKDHLVSKSSEMYLKIEELDGDVQQLRTQMQPMRVQLDASIKKKDEMKTVNRRKLEQSRVQFNHGQKKVNEILHLQSVIEEFYSKNIINQMDAVNEVVAELKTELDKYSEKKENIDKSVDELKRQINNSQMYYRELQDNVQLRTKRKKTIELTKEIDELDEKLGKNDIRKIRQEKQKLVERYENLRERKHKAQGMKTELNDSISELKKELEQPKMMKAAFEYKRKFLDLKLHERALVDLKQFVQAMDWSLMQYHRQRMIQVNSIVKELWRNIYKGNDIDYIEIKTDDIRTVGQERRKLYSYRVVQVKNQVELEMKGRCSAGQRVLASLIIRIALAETFSTNCGILALDEPTTNLDRENIISLSETLIELIQQKRQQKNFQLVIITHDQDFVDRLTIGESLESYYVVKRNEFGKSVITVKTR